MLFFKKNFPEPDALRVQMNAAYRMDETLCVTALLEKLHFEPEKRNLVAQLAKQLVTKVREGEAERSGIEMLMMHYDLSTEEGIMLMCLAEALLRIPDKETEDLLIRDKLTSVDWEKHLGQSESSFVNMATWGLALGGKILKKPEQAKNYFWKLWGNLVAKSSEPVIRQAVREAIKVLSEHFVLGRTIDEALKHSQPMLEKNYAFSYDMLGEVARTEKDAERYFAAYNQAIIAIGNSHAGKNLFHGPNISVKLSALHPRYEANKREETVPFLVEKLKSLALQAKNSGVSLTVDAEEADRLNLSLDIFKEVFTDPLFQAWEGLGLAVQAYQKRAYPLITWLIDLARKHRKRIQVRLVKGAYWDSEIKMSQVGGYTSYPVFTRKVSTDISYLACAKQLLAAQDAIYPQFATHNPYSVAAILSMMDDTSKYDFEFQSLQGMGRSLHDVLVSHFQVGCRIYAPVGSHEDLLPYLVRRLLENGANSSFVHKVADKNTPIEILIANPIEQLKSYAQIPNPKIPLPKNIFGNDRINSSGIDWSDDESLKNLSKAMEAALNEERFAAPFNRDLVEQQNIKNILNPTDHRDIVGKYVEATAEDVESALQRAKKAYESWDALGFAARAHILNKMGDLLEKHGPELIAIAVREAGKTVPNAWSEIREATDFCRYYAHLASTKLIPQELKGYTGESNSLRMHGRGVMVCISPWNFPIAIFTGQVAASLVSGNAVIAKPAQQTPLVAARIVEVFYAAGVPKEVLQLLPGRGSVVGNALMKDPRIDGVLFTGSTETAKLIQQNLAQLPGNIVQFIAETGGINAMIADSSALPEQLVGDILTSAFDSAGQRCSALRVLCVQEETADKVIEMLKGAMAEMTIGNPLLLSSDVGPVIDKSAFDMLLAHQEKMMKEAKLIYRVELPPETQYGTFIAPQAYELPGFHLIKKEVFGPILHVIRYQQKDLAQVIDNINALGYGLTFGVHSRIEKTIDFIQSRIKAGNIYVNRNMIGAVVGVQPFGGHRLSGTGPKAGGPHYLSRLCTESTLTINTVAMGGNASLMTMED